jgi:hypothetical protein
MIRGGAKTWFFPDGYLPEKVAGSKLEAHEALMLLNTCDSQANITLDFYFDNKPPIKGILVEVQAERIKTLRLDNPEDIGGVLIEPLVQYSIRVTSSLPIVAQFGRLDTTQNNLAYYCAPGFWENE